MEMPGRELLDALYRLELQVVQFYGVVQRLVASGVRGPQVEHAIEMYQAVSRGLHNAERSCYDKIVRELRRVPGGEALVSQVPVPQPFPEINFYGGARGGGATARAGLSGGLGLGPLVVGGVAIAPWVVVLLAVAAVAAFALTLYFGAELVATVTAQINQTRRYYQQILSFERSFQTCLSRGFPPERCQEAAMPPAPPEDPHTSGWPWWLTGLAVVGGLAALGGLAYVVIRAKRPWGLPAGSYRPVRWSLAGTRDYGLEVE